jgi:hypothetical protein
VKLVAALPYCIAALLGAAIAGWIGSNDEQTEAQAVASPLAQPPPQGQADKLAVAGSGEANARTLGAVRGDPFYAPVKPPPPPVVPAPPPAQVAPPPPPPEPPFPYRFVGRVIGPGGEPVVYLAKDERLLTVRGKGDLGDGYQVDELTDRQLVVTRVASQRTHVIEFGENAESPRSP